MRIRLRPARRALISLCLITTTLANSNIASAETAPQSKDEAEGIEEVTGTLETVEVVGKVFHTQQSPQETTIKGDALHLQQADTLGKTLESQLGVANASFGPGVGVPVIRGLSGSRVRIMQDGIGSHDASTISPDHAVAIEPLFAEQIDIVRGPDTIRYGGSAIGGMVNVKDNRIPERVPTNPVEGAVESRFDTNADGNNSAFKLDLGENMIALRLGGFYRHRNDTEIPAEAIDADAIQAQFGLSNILNAEKTIPNTDSESSGGSVGLSWLGESGGWYVCQPLQQSLRHTQG